MHMEMVHRYEPQEAGFIQGFAMGYLPLLIIATELQNHTNISKTN